jgi:hypothetical protein
VVLLDLADRVQDHQEQDHREQEQEQAQVDLVESI